MNNRRRRIVKAQRNVRRLIEELRPEGSSLRSRVRTMTRLEELHALLRRPFLAPYWY